MLSCHPQPAQKLCIAEQLFCHCLGVSATPSQAADGFAGTVHLSDLALLLLRSSVAKVSFPLGLCGLSVEAEWIGTVS